MRKLDNTEAFITEVFMMAKERGINTLLIANGKVAHMGLTDEEDKILSQLENKIVNIDTTEDDNFIFTFYDLWGLLKRYANNGASRIYPRDDEQFASYRLSNANINKRWFSIDKRASITSEWKTIGAMYFNEDSADVFLYSKDYFKPLDSNEYVKIGMGTDLFGDVHWWNAFYNHRDVKEAIKEIMEG